MGLVELHFSLELGESMDLLFQVRRAEKTFISFTNQEISNVFRLDMFRSRLTGLSLFSICVFPVSLSLYPLFIHASISNAIPPSHTYTRAHSLSFSLSLSLSLSLVLDITARYLFLFLQSVSLTTIPSPTRHSFSYFSPVLFVCVCECLCVSVCVCECECLSVCECVCECLCV